MKVEKGDADAAYSSSRLRRLFIRLERPKTVLASDSEEKRLRDLQSPSQLREISELHSPIRTHQFNFLGNDLPLGSAENELL